MSLVSLCQIMEMEKLEITICYFLKASLYPHWWDLQCSNAAISSLFCNLLKWVSHVSAGNHNNYLNRICCWAKLLVLQKQPEERMSKKTNCAKCLLSHRVYSESWEGNLVMTSPMLARCQQTVKEGNNSLNSSLRQAQNRRRLVTTTLI